MTRGDVSPDTKPGSLRRENRDMKPNQVKSRRLELGLTVAELAFALDMDADEILRIETGESDRCRCAEFEEAFDAFEEKIFGTFAGA